MIGSVIAWCIQNRVMVLMLSVFVVLGGIWAATNITVDAIPDLSDVQVIIRTEYPGQAPEIIEEQVTYPLTTTMLAVPGSKVVRGYSMFGTSFVYVIFDDGTDMYWARSRVLEQLNFVSGLLPDSVSPQLGPDATGVGWVYEYALVTGEYCEDHPNGLWHDATEDQWYEDPQQAPRDVRDRLDYRRTFSGRRHVYVDMLGNRYDRLEDAPPEIRKGLAPLVIDEGLHNCPLDGKPLVRSDTDLAQLRSLQDWYLRYELTALEGVSEIASVGGFVKQYQVVVDPVKLLAYKMPLEMVSRAIRESNRDVGGRLVEMSETEYMVRGLGYLGTPDAGQESVAGESLTETVLDQLRKTSLGATPEGSPIYLRDVADIRIGPDI
ncbi:MAG: efflux RND transporter permease subunit, partial [Aureliella sp.]